LCETSQGLLCYGLL
nr:immunoglobulin heavy chain junction region [Mus musculus]